MSFKSTDFVSKTMEQFEQKIATVSLKTEMEKNYLDYAMSVIVGRALPDVRDGLKPVHRRVLYGMHEMHNVWNRPYVKCARVVGEVMGKFHPHGDQSIYDTLVRMAQDFSLRYTMVDGQGNFGSVDGDKAAAMRYTECRLEHIADEMLADIEKDTVDFVPNYDGKENEPSVLPAKIPNLLINGSTGIAVGMATNIPPHNLVEVINAALYLLDNPQCEINDLIERIPAPDFPTGGIIYGISGVREGYTTGRGRVVMRAKTHFENIGKKQDAIVVDELPYLVNKKTLLENIIKIKNEGKESQLAGISEIRDESNKEGIRVVIELKNGTNAQIILNHLFKLTQLQDSFGINIVALVDGQPKQLNLKQLLDCFLFHRREVVTRRTMFDLKRARERGHVLEGFAVAVDNIDKIIAIIRGSANRQIARTKLMECTWTGTSVQTMLQRASEKYSNQIEDFRPEGLPKGFGIQADGRYKLSETQTAEILQMQLQRLTGLDRENISKDYQAEMEQIAEFIDILGHAERIKSIIRDELVDVKNRYGINAKDGGKRRSVVEMDAQDQQEADLIKREDRVIMLTNKGFIKSQLLSEYRAQKHGGRGKKATVTQENDWVEQLFIANTHDFVLFFSDDGVVYRRRVWEIPTVGKGAKGDLLRNVLYRDAIKMGDKIPDKVKITAVLPLSGGDQDFPENRYVFMATKEGVVKKTSLSEFRNIRKGGIRAIELDKNNAIENEDNTDDTKLEKFEESQDTYKKEKDDVLIGVALTDGEHDVMLFSDNGKVVRFNESDVRSMGRQARGVKGMTLSEEQSVIALLVVDASAVVEESDANEELDENINETEENNSIESPEMSDVTNATQQESVDKPKAKSIEPAVLTIAEDGIGKRTPISQYACHRRGAKGMIAQKIANRNVKVVATTLVRENDEIMLISSNGIIIRSQVNNIRTSARSTQGVKIMRVDEGQKVIGMQRILEADIEKEDKEEKIETDALLENPTVDAIEASQESDEETSD